MEKYVEIITGGIYIVASLCFLIYSFYRTKKAKNAEEAERLKGETVTMIQNTAMELIQKAEEFKNYTGEEKFNYVLTRLKQLNQNLYGESELGEIINELVKMSNNVNVEKKEESKNGNNRK